MSRILPHPLLAVALALLWLLLAGFTPGHAVLAVGAGLLGSFAFSALGETSPRIGRWSAIPELAAFVFVDVLRSNLDVARIAVGGRRRPRTSGIIVVPLRLKDPTALAVLSIVLTSTPGTAWLDFDAARGELLLHVLDLVDERHWQDLIANRYERLLMEIFP